ncbi:MAG: hypothetical protein GY786_09200 [Proteobacteria bacterium]|nr:hypothetical protein [Pseudomonadota bacterium]
MKPINCSGIYGGEDLAVEWWNNFQKFADTLKNSQTVPPAVKDHINSARKLFSLYAGNEDEIVPPAEQELKFLQAKVNTLHCEIKNLEEKLNSTKSGPFFKHFALSIDEGLKSLTDMAKIDDELPLIMDKWAPITMELDSIKSYTADLISKITEQEDKFIVLCNENAPRRSSAEKDSDLTPELTDFMWFIDRHIKNRYGIEHSLKTLNSNLNPKIVRKSGEVPSFKFRIEPIKVPHTYKIVATRSNQVSRLDQTIVDLLTQVPILKNRIVCEKYALKNKKVVPFVKMHSEKNQLGFFKQTPGGQIASKLFEILLDLLQSLEPLRVSVVQLINRSPLMDLEKVFENMNSDEVKGVIRKKFQSWLPGLNDDRQRIAQNKTHLMRQIRTIKTMNKFEQELQNELKRVSGSLKQVLALRFWVTKLLITVQKNNRVIESKALGKPKSPKNTLNVGINFTIGAHDPEQFLIDPEDIIADKESFQRTSKKDQWVSVNTSEKMLRMDRGDFYIILKDFFENNLNPLLKRFGFDDIEFMKELMPEVQERMEDEERIQQIRSGILGTTLSKADDFINSYRFHNLFRQFFQTSDYSKTQYLYREKFSLLSGEMAQSNISIIRIRYRRINVIKEEIELKIKQLKKHLHKTETPKNEIQLKIRYKHLKNLLPLLNTIIQVMQDANPTLEEAKIPER